ncbi:SWIM zinc finger family protein [Streptomyces sp. PU-14G]|uniref:SWIM zinc finger family protein n=1 Tax=Streptomyces sp. PU-14G TaxID=2800808 RepID=UPI0034E02848
MSGFAEGDEAAGGERNGKPRPLPDDAGEYGPLGSAWVRAVQATAGDGARDTARLARGRAYAHEGGVFTVRVGPGRVSAYVSGSRPRPYRAQWRLPALSEREWHTFLKTLAARPAHVAAVLDGAIPSQALAEAASAGARLLPAPGDLTPACSCPDQGAPCKHAAALGYETARLLDGDPGLLFRLRGRSAEAVRAELLKRATAREATARLGRPPGPGPGSVADPGPADDLAPTGGPGPMTDPGRLSGEPGRPVPVPGRPVPEPGAGQVADGGAGRDIGRCGGATSAPGSAEVGSAGAHTPGGGVSVPEWGVSTPQGEVSTPEGGVSGSDTAEGSTPVAGSRTTEPPSCRVPAPARTATAAADEACGSATGPAGLSAPARPPHGGEVDLIVTAATTEAPGVTGAPGITDAPAVTDAPVVTDAPGGSGAAGTMLAREVFATTVRPPLPAPLPPPEEADVHQAVYPELAGAPHADALAFLAADAATRARQALSAVEEEAAGEQPGPDPLPELSLWHDTIRLAATHPRLTGRRTLSPLFAALARSAGREVLELARAAAAWRQGGQAGLEVMDTVWDPPAGAFDRGRSALAALGITMTIHRNRLTHTSRPVQLRYGKDGRWYPYRADPVDAPAAGGRAEADAQDGLAEAEWWPEGSAALDPVRALTGLREH